MYNADFFFGKEILVTGASGFIGSALCSRLKSLGANIHAVSRERQSKSEVIDRWYKGDLVNFDFTRTIIREVAPDIIFHLAGLTTGKRDLKAILPTYHNNLTATINILVACSEINVLKIIYTGSMEEPDINSKSIPVSPYAASKWACTTYSRVFHKLYRTPIVNARVFMVYGPGDNDIHRLIPYVVRTLAHNEKPELTSGKRLVDWIYVDDVVEGLVRMTIADGIEGKTIDLGSGNLHSIHDICKKIGDIVDPSIQMGFGEIPDRIFERECVADVSMSKSYLDWKPEVSLDEGLKNTVEWFLKTV